MEIVWSESFFNRRTITINFSLYSLCLYLFNCLNFICWFNRFECVFFVLFFWLLLHSLAVKISLTFYDFLPIITVRSRSTTGRSVTTRWFVAVDLLIYYFYFIFVLGLNFIFLCFKLIIIHYHTPKQSIIKFKPRMKLNHNTYSLFLCFNISLCTYFIRFEHFHKSSRQSY